MFRRFASKPTSIISSRSLGSSNIVAAKTWEQPKFIQNQPLQVHGANFEDAMSWPKAQLSGLPNGLRVVTENIPWNTNTCAIGVFIDAGSRYETIDNNGCAHFLEHLAFKGTNKRRREQLEMEVEDMGGHLNAYTSREQTVYYAQVLKNDTEQAVDILSDILLNSTLESSAIERERAVILQEMENVYNETKEELIFDHLHENCYQDCALGRTILGPISNIKKINRDDLIDYINTYYTANRMVIVGVGDIQHEQFVNLISEKFSKIPEKSNRTIKKDESYFRGSEYTERWDDQDYVYLALAYETCPWNHSDTYPLMFMQQMLGQWDKRYPGGQHHVLPLISYLYSDPSRPIAESYMAFNTPYTDTGLFGVYGVLHPYEVSYFCDAVRFEMNRFGYSISEEMLKDTRERLKTTMLLSLGNTAQIMEEVGRQMLVHGRRIHPCEAFKRIDDVDTNAIKIAAHKYLIDKDHTIAAVGPVHEMPEYGIFRWKSTRPL